jgi:hypothetical protein
VIGYDRRMKRCIITVCAVILLYSASSVREAEAQGHPGIRLGLTDDPDTITGGFFYEFLVTRLGRSGYLTLEPGIDVGGGDNLFTIRGTFNAHFIFLVGRDVQLYPIIGGSVYYWRNDNDNDNTDGGLNLGGGVQFDRFSFEFWFGIDDIPDFTFLFGISF